MESWTKSLLATLALTFAASAHAEGLAFRWSTEVSHALPYEAQAMQGESFTLEARLVQYGQPMTGAAKATFYYQTKAMPKEQWYTAPATWDATSATASVAFTPALDVGATAYRWFFGVETTAGKNYRAFGTLRLKPSPGFSPAALEPVDVRDEIIADVIDEIDGRYLKLTGGDVTGTITSRLSSASVPGLTVTLGNDDRYYAKHTQAGIQARREVYAPEEFYAFFDVSGGDKIARLKDLGSFLREESDPTVPAWAKASSKPAYAWSEISGKPTTWAWSAITGKPATYAPSAHTHAVSSVDGLQAALDEKQDTLTFDGEPTEGSTNPAKSGGIFAWVKNLLAGYLPLTGGTVTGKTTIMGTTFQNKGWVLTTELSEGGKWLKEKYAFKAHTHADLAPLSAVSVTTNAVTYVWIWDDAEGTFALAPTE